MNSLKAKNVVCRHAVNTLPESIFDRLELLDAVNRLLGSHPTSDITKIMAQQLRDHLKTLHEAQQELPLKFEEEK